MKVTSDMINQELRFNGKLLTAFLGTPSEESFKKRQRSIRRFIVGHKSKNIKCEEITIKKKNGDPLRLCIYSPLSKVKNMTGFLWIHGGGYAFGVPEIFHMLKNSLMLQRV